MRILLICLLLQSLSFTCYAEEENKPKENTKSEKVEEGVHKKSIFWMPLASMILPGLDQWIEGQYLEASIYSSAALGSIIYSARVSNLEMDKKDREDKKKHADLRRHSVADQKLMVGGMGFQLSGYYSNYTAFNTALPSHQAHGEYQFLKERESVPDLMFAAIDVRYLARPTTLAPIGIVGGLGYLIHRSAKNVKDYHRKRLDGSDAVTTSFLSFGAGTGEEAVFRGWLMPVLREQTGSDFWSNASQGLIFGALHYSSLNPMPLIQTAGGWYYGWLTQRNSWSIGESVFIHYWWDMIAIGVAYSIRKDNPDVEYLEPLQIPLPPLTLVF